MKRSIVFVAAAAALFAVTFPVTTNAATTLQKCVKTVGKLGDKCIAKAPKELAELIDPADGLLAGLTSLNTPKIVSTCNAFDARDLGFRNQQDAAEQVNTACDLFTYEMNSLVYSSDQVGLTDAQLKCRSQMYKAIGKTVKLVSKAYGKKCIVKEYSGKPCDTAKRDASVTKAADKMIAKITKTCGADFDAVATFAGATLEERIADFANISVIRGKHFAQRVYPPNNVGETGELGEFLVGLKTIDWEDATRLNVAGTGPRPVKVEIYYPTTAAATVGVGEEVASIFGVPLFNIPAFRDVDLAPGAPFPVVLFSHGNEGTRIQSFFFASVLASHGFIVVSPDHHGNTLEDAFDDPDVAINRPLDMSFVIDELELANVDVGNFLEGALDLTKIGASGHSFGGYTVLTLAGGAFAGGTFTDTRVKSIFPQTPASSVFDAAFFASITVPTLVVGATIDETTPFLTDSQNIFDGMVSGASVVGLAEIVQAGHFTFSSFCEVDPLLLAGIGGFEEACEPRHIPWRHAQDLTMYLAQNFFDATLNGNAAALANLDPSAIAGFGTDDVVYQNK